MTIPDCHSRRAIPGERAYYFCAHPLVHSRGNLVTEGSCAVCDRWREPAPEAVRPMPADPVTRVTGTCEHLGEQIGLRECPTCRGRVSVKVFRCSHPRHRETTIGECGVCADFSHSPNSGSPETNPAFDEASADRSKSLEISTRPE